MKRIYSVHNTLKCGLKNRVGKDRGICSMDFRNQKTKQNKNLKTIK